MTGHVTPGLKTTLVAHALFGGILGLLYLLLPVRWGELVGWPAAQPLDHRVIGAAFLAFALASWLAKSETEWSRVRIVVLMQAAFTSLAAVLMLTVLLTGGVPAAGWVYFACLGALAIAFWLAYTRNTRA